MAQTNKQIQFIEVIDSDLGFNKLSLSNRDSNGIPQVLSGSCIESSNAYFIFSSNETITGLTALSPGNIYMKVVPAGTAGNQTITSKWTNSAPSYIASKGCFASTANTNMKTLYSAVKISDTEIGFKQRLCGEPATMETAGYRFQTAGLTAGTSVSGEFTIYEMGMYCFNTDITTGQTVSIAFQLKSNGGFPNNQPDSIYQFYTSTLNGKRVFPKLLMPGIYRAFMSEVGAAAPFTCYVTKTNGYSCGVTQ